MTKANTVNVHILDKDYCISCPPSERERLEESARYLHRKMREIRSTGKVIGTERIAVMAALNIAHELLHRGHVNSPSVNAPAAPSEPQNAEIQAQIQTLLARANVALGGKDAEDA